MVFIANVVVFLRLFDDDYHKLILQIDTTNLIYGFLWVIVARGFSGLVYFVMLAKSSP